MVVTRKDSHQPFRLNKRLHKAKIAMIVAIWSRAVVFVTYLLCVEARFSVLANSSRLLESASCLNWDMDKGEAGNNSTILVFEMVAGVAKP
jgi:hypothetical protein